MTFEQQKTTLSGELLKRRDSEVTFRTFYEELMPDEYQIKDLLSGLTTEEKSKMKKEITTLIDTKVLDILLGFVSPDKQEQFLEAYSQNIINLHLIEEMLYLQSEEDKPIMQILREAIEILIKELQQKAYSV